MPKKLVLHEARVTYAPFWEESDDEGKPFGGHGILGLHEISLECFPLDVQQAVEAVIREAETALEVKRDAALAERAAQEEREEAERERRWHEDWQRKLASEWDAALRNSRGGAS